MDGLDGEAEGGVLGRFHSWNNKFAIKFQTFQDRVAPHLRSRWGVSVGLVFLLFLRVFLAQGWFIVAYAWGIYVLNLFIHFITPKSDPEMDMPGLPQSRDDEFRPFERKLPEFKFWWSFTRATLLAFLASFFSAFDIPVYWPILLVYFIILLVLTMKKEVAKWIQLGYVPWSRGKKTYQ